MSALEVRIDDGTAVVLHRGEPRWTYCYGDRPRPFLHPVRTPAGHVLTVDAPDDHPWHHGLWFTIKFVNGENFWEEYDEFGLLHHVGDPTVGPSTGDDATWEGLSIASTIEWVRPDGDTVVIREQRRHDHLHLHEGAYAIDVLCDLTPEVDIVLDRTPFTTWGGYGGLTFRGRPDLRDTRLLLDDATEVERLEGRPAHALDLSGVIDDQPVGIALLNAPDNPHDPVPWYASCRHATYGAGSQDWSNFANAAFLFHEPLEVGAGQPLVLRHRVVVHDGSWDHATLVGALEDYRRHLDAS